MIGSGSLGTSVCQLTCEDHFTVPGGDQIYQSHLTCSPAENNLLGRGDRKTREDISKID